MQPLLMPEYIPAVGIMGCLAPVSRGSWSTLVVEKMGIAMNGWGQRVSHPHPTVGQREIRRTSQGGAEARRARQFPRDPPQAELWE
jgi:hypothetical protein